MYSKLHREEAMLEYFVDLKKAEQNAATNTTTPSTTIDYSTWSTEAMHEKPFEFDYRKNKLNILKNSLVQEFKMLQKQVLYI